MEKPLKPLSLLKHLTFCNYTVSRDSKKSSPVTGPEWPKGFQEVEVPRFHDNGTGWW